MHKQQVQKQVQKQVGGESKPRRRRTHVEVGSPETAQEDRGEHRQSDGRQRSQAVCTAAVARIKVKARRPSARLPAVRGPLRM
jgi:hypothetical protein